MKRNLGRNSKLIKIHNRGLVLKKVLQNCMISRKEIAEQSGLTQAAITKIVNVLMAQGLVVEKEMEQASGTTGRRPIGLCMNNSNYRIAVVEIGRYRITTALLDLSGNIIFRKNNLEGFSALPLENLSSIIAAQLNEMIEENGIDRNLILGIGISAPGPINKKTGKSAEGGKRFDVPYDWRGIHILEVLEDEFKIPVFADNSGNISALAEGWFGQAKDIMNFVQYTVGLGIGSGVILDGFLYRGDDDVVSEIGHITVDLNGPVCSCGNIGCLELYAGFKNLLPDYYSRQGLAPRDWSTVSNDEIVKEIEAVWKRAADNESEALDAISRLAELLGIGAVSLTNIFSPECIIVSANDVGELDISMLTARIEAFIKQHAFVIVSDIVRVIPSELGGDIHLLGSAALVLQELFTDENFLANSGS